jgi:GMP synthase (glutamine-hydrolysing)
MTADFYAFEPAFLGRPPTCAIGEVRGINRVVYDYISMSTETIEWE